jgi:hypothetical protein
VHTRSFCTLATRVVVGAALWSLLPVSLEGQTAPVTSTCPDDAPAVFHPCALAAAKTFTPPRTADGTPDLSGLWRRRAAAFEDLEAHPRNADDNGGPSVVVDPSDGKVPMQPWADLRRRENAAKFLHHNAACLLAGSLGTMYMANIYQFIQNRDAFSLVGEGLSAHPYRHIPIGERPHVGKTMLLWQGDLQGLAGDEHGRMGHPRPRGAAGRTRRAGGGEATRSRTSPRRSPGARRTTGTG